MRFECGLSDSRSTVFSVSTVPQTFFPEVLTGDRKAQILSPICQIRGLKFIVRYPGAATRLDYCAVFSAKYHPLGIMVERGLFHILEPQIKGCFEKMFAKQEKSCLLLQNISAPRL
uniref:Uncharacterized protein n=1 Tax=Spongospora subterranea TaxID=70186 RepID=A0A0H5R2Y5_9EUKA|eukprot:CRZ08568.1 hypothetical protein [Spongospora subterranea]